MLTPHVAGRRIIRTNEVWIIREGHTERRVVRRAVIAFAVVFHHQLPVRLFDDGGLVGDLEVGHVVRAEVTGSLIREVTAVGRNGGEADVNQPLHFATVNDAEAVLFGITIVPHFTRPEERSVEVIGPLVIGANELRRSAFGRRTNAAATVTAGVVERTRDTISAPHHDDRRITQGDGHIVASGRQFRSARRENPFAVP